LNKTNVYTTERGWYIAIRNQMLTVDIIVGGYVSISWRPTTCRNIMSNFIKQI